MTVGEARETARDWVLRSRDSIPNFVGAFCFGSVAHKGEDETFPATSDIDVPVVIDGPVPDSFMDPAAPLAQRKIFHRGVVIERHAWTLDGLRNIEGHLAGTGASAFCTSGVILDPAGEIARVQREVSSAYRKQRWVEARVQSAAGQAALFIDQVTSVSAAARLTGYASDLILKAVQLYFPAIVPALQIPCLAHLDPFTFRRAFASARPLYESHGASGLYRRILEVMGSADMRRDEAEALLEEYAEAFDRAVRVVRTPFYPDCELQAFCRPIVVGGAADLVRNGFHRESMLFVATVRSWMQNAIENDGSEEDKRASGKGYERLLAALGISGVPELVAKAEALRALLPDLRELAEAVMEENPRIDRS